MKPEFDSRSAREVPGCWQVFCGSRQDFGVFRGQQISHVFESFRDHRVREIRIAVGTAFDRVRVAEPDVMVTDGDDVVMRENLIGYASRIDECPVGAVQVHHECGAAMANQQQVMATDEFALD